MGPIFPPCMTALRAGVLSAFLDGVPEPHDLSVPQSVQHVMGVLLPLLRARCTISKHCPKHVTAHSAWQWLYERALLSPILQN